MFGPIPYDPPRPSLGFWVSEGFAPGLSLAGFTPCQAGRCGPDEVHVEQGGHVGRLLRFVFAADIADAP